MTGAATWTARSVSDHTALEPAPPPVPPADAQPWCNFVLWTPVDLPAGYTVDTGTLRRQAPPGRSPDPAEGRTPWSTNNTAVYRFEVAGPGCRFRIKQFLYEWPFPALDQPCLWNSPTTALPLDERYLLWRGVDYLHRPGASARLARTTIELSIMDGELSDEQAVAFYRALRPVDPAAAAAIGATPLAELSYWARHPDAAMVSVPTGLWVLRRSQHSHPDEVPVGAAAAVAVTRAAGLPGMLGGFDVDSAVRFTRPGRDTETEIVYAGGPDRGHELRLIVQRPGAGRLEVPARPEPHPGHRQIVPTGGVPVQLGWLDERYGPFHAVFAVPGTGLEVTLLSSAGVGLDRGWYDGVLADLLHVLRGSPARSGALR
jgi:hypothetical protein